MFTYSHANTPLSQSERAYYLSYFIINHRLALRKRNIFPSGFRSTIGIYGFHELNLRPFLNTSIRPGIIRSGTKLSLLTETLTAWYSRIWSLSTWDFTLTTWTGTYSGIEIPEAWMSTIRQHDNWPLPRWNAKGSASSSHNAKNALDRNPPTMSEVCDTRITDNHGGTNSSTQYIDNISWWRPAVCGRNVAINIKVTIVRQTIKLNPLGQS